MRLRFDVVDVFSDRPFAGNQLAVVQGADTLSTTQCLAVAREFNFSETTFPASSVHEGAEYSTRIFTPGGEIPFAGHPTLGTAWVLRERGFLASGEVVQICGAGRIGVRFRPDGDVELSAAPRDLLGPLEDELVAALLEQVGLEPSDRAGPVWVAGCGLTFIHVPVRRDALARATASDRPLREHADALDRHGEAADPVEGLNLFSVTGSAPTLTVRSRVFVPGLSVPEDPATGSAAAGLGVALVAAGLLPQGGSYDITQGVEMGRPSRLHGRVETTLDERGAGAEERARPGGASGRVAACHVSGGVHHVASGEIRVPTEDRALTED